MDDKKYERGKRYNVFYTRITALFKTTGASLKKKGQTLKPCNTTAVARDSCWYIGVILTAHRRAFSELCCSLEHLRLLTTSPPRVRSTMDEHCALRGPGKNEFTASKDPDSSLERVMQYSSKEIQESLNDVLEEGAREGNHAASRRVSH